MTIKEKIAEIMSNEQLADNDTKINEIIASLGSYMVSKDQYNKKVKELGDLSNQMKGLQNEKLSYEEQSKKELEDLINRTKQNEYDYKLKSNRLEAIEIFKNAGLSESDYKDFVDKESKSYIVSDDEEKTKVLAQSFINTINSQKKLVEAQLKAEWQGKNPVPPAGDNSNAMTKEKLNKMTYSEEMAFAKENPEVYAKLISNK